MINVLSKTWWTTLTKTLCATFLVLGDLSTIRADFYVAPSGSDQNEGSEAKPFATLERARDTVRKLKNSGGFPKEGVTLWLRRGNYIRTNALELTREDSGTTDGPMVWRAYGDESVRLLGGRMLPGFTQVTEPKILARLDETARGHVVQLALGEPGLSGGGEMKSRGFGRPTVSAHCELFFGGRPMNLARWPNEGAWEKIAGFPETTGDDHGGKIGELKSGFSYAGERPRRWKANPKTETILSLLAEPLLKLSDASHIVVRGLILEATRGNAVEIRGGRSNLIAGCLMRNVGNNAVVIEGGRNHGVTSCDMFDTGDGGVSLTGGDRQTLRPGGHFVENCHFQRQGRLSKCYVPAVLLSGVGQRVSHNLIHDHPHAAILFTGNDHLIEFNEIHHIALETGDVGAIYTGRDYSFRGNRIRHNYIHETGGVGMGSMGVYMDDCVSGTEVFGNVFYKVHWAMFIGGGRDHRVENNLFVECDPAVRADGRGLDKSPVWHEMVNDYMRKQLAAVPLNLYRDRYPAMKALDAYYGPPDGDPIVGDAFKGVPPGGNVITRNVAVGKWFDVGWNATTEMFELKDNYLTTDPKLIGTTGERFRLPKDSPVWNIGFQPIPFEQIGLRPDADRQRLEIK